MTQNDVDVDALWEKHSIERNEMNYEGFKKAITEALAGRWAKDEDVIAFARFYAFGEDPRPIHDILTQFKSERGI